MWALPVVTGWRWRSQSGFHVLFKQENRGKLCVHLLQPRAFTKIQHTRNWAAPSICSLLVPAQLTSITTSTLMSLLWGFTSLQFLLLTISGVFFLIMFVWLKQHFIETYFRVYINLNRWWIRIVKLFWLLNSYFSYFKLPNILLFRSFSVCVTVLQM